MEMELSAAHLGKSHMLQYVGYICRCSVAEMLYCYQDFVGSKLNPGKKSGKTAVIGRTVCAMMFELQSVQCRRIVTAGLFYLTSSCIVCSTSI